MKMDEEKEGEARRSGKKTKVNEFGKNHYNMVQKPAEPSCSFYDDLSVRAKLEQFR